MNLYSNKQKWKVVLLIIALGMVTASLFVSNSIVQKVSERERERARQWGGAIQKKLELVRLTNHTFTQLRDRELEKMELLVAAQKEVLRPAPADAMPDYTFPMSIVNQNNDIPVILLENDENISQYRNIELDTAYFRNKYSNFTEKQVRKAFEDSLLRLADAWRKKNPSFTIEVFEGLFLTYIYNDSREIQRLERERDSLIQSFNQELIDNEGLVPVILMDGTNDSIIGSNLPAEKTRKENLRRTLSDLEAQNTPIVLDFRNGTVSHLYYDSSPELKQLQFFPYIQFLIIGLFALIGYLIFSTFRKAEQNQVWAGMAKETAHQLGTPLSSLMAWIQLLESENINQMIPQEMEKDVKRLEKVTDRFSKIGSGAKLDDKDLTATVENVMSYLRPRISDKVEIHTEIEQEVEAAHNGSLMEWVIENICKNAVDAMEGRGSLYVSLKRVPEWAYIEIKDSGKGIPQKHFKTIFQPGYSTKKRGWGLGLSLVRRIVREYHHGKVYVLDSQVNVGTTFRIAIPL